jgi:hypothetical protein
LKRLALLLAALSIALAAIYSVRAGAISLALALALYSIPGGWNRRRMDIVIPIILVISLITVALALPRR